MTDADLPNWAREVVTLLPACAHFLLSGNIHDHYFVGAAAADGFRAADDNATGGAILRPLPLLMAEAVRESRDRDHRRVRHHARGAGTIPADAAVTERAERISAGA